MIYLLIVSLLWAFSFGLIKNTLAGVDASFIAAIRLLLATLVFLPMFKGRKMPSRFILPVLVSGMLQFGLMYLAYNHAFNHLKAHEVALMTITTPIYMAVFDAFLKKHFSWKILLVALLAVIGTAIVIWHSPQTRLLDLWQGLVLVQLSNIAFATGLILYRHVLAQIQPVKDHQVMALPYLGGLIIAAISSLLFTDFSQLKLAPNQIFVLVYLGIVASGIGFFLWNLGARKVQTGTLAVFNNLKTPLAIAVSLIFFGEQANLTRLICGGLVLMLALWFNESSIKPKPKDDHPIGKTS